MSFDPEYQGFRTQFTHRLPARLEELGYRNVAVYRGGKEDWVEHALPVERSTDGLQR